MMIRKTPQLLKGALVMGGTLAILSTAGIGLAQIRAEKVFTADSKKTKAYIRDGMIVGGHRDINDVTIKDIRYSSNKKFDRIVIDLEGNINGEPAGVPRPPYYQLAVTPDEKRLVMNMWGKPQIGFDFRKKNAAFNKPKSTIRNMALILPVPGEDILTLTFNLRSAVKVEVFELGKPTRIIMDIQKKKD